MTIARSTPHRTSCQIVCGKDRPSTDEERVGSAVPAAVLEDMDVCERRQKHNHGPVEFPAQLCYESQRSHELHDDRSALICMSGAYRGSMSISVVSE